MVSINIHRARGDGVDGKLWIISFAIRGQEVVTLFNQETADLARALAAGSQPGRPPRRRDDDPDAEQKGDEI